MERPRSIYVAFDVFPRGKGSSSHIAAMVEALAQRHGPVWLLCLGYGDMPGYQEEGAVAVHRFKLYHPNLLKRAEGFAEFVAAKIAAADPELIVFRDPWGGAPALDAAPEAAAVFEVNALPSWELPYTYPAVGANPALLAKLADRERYCLLLADGIITVSTVTREALIGLGAQADRIAVIPNSAADHFFSAEPEACDLPELAAGEWFGYIGSLHAWQGVELLLDAFALAAPELPAVKLLLVATGGKDRLRLIRKRIHKLGLDQRAIIVPPQDPERLGPIMARLAFTAAPLLETGRNTRQGCCPVKIVESMAAGAPVLASDLRVCRDLIAPGEGLLIPPNNPRAWARALIDLFTDPDRLSRLRSCARSRARRDFSRALMNQRLEASFNAASERTVQTLDPACGCPR
jgi:glycosyltransferase involved in cell wall biosynthesis